MAQKEVDVKNYVTAVVEGKGAGKSARLKGKHRICRLCLSEVAVRNGSRHASYHRRCNFCDTFHYLKDLQSGKCPVYNSLLDRFFPSAKSLKIKIF